MSIPATSEKSKPLTPPDERFWQRYSPHHEFPLSGITSLVVHGLVIGAMLLVGWWLSRKWQDDLAKPPSMDVVQLEGGTGSEGWGGGDGLPGKSDPKGGKQEFVELTLNQKDSKPETPQARLKDPVLDPLKVSDVPISETAELSVVDLDDVGKQADDTLRKLMDLPKRPANTGSITVGPAGGKGTGPVGPGVGFKKGTGTGTGGIPAARPVTRQDILAWRWRFDLAGDGREHAKKLDAAGVIVGVPDGRGGIVVTRNLKVRPVKLAQENLQPFKDAVKWYNTKPDSLFKLAQELRIQAPQFVVLLLPKEREDKMATAEQEYTRMQGRRMEEVTATWFDFRLQGGAYEPFVLKQEYGQ